MGNPASKLIGATSITLVSLMMSSLLSVATSAFIARTIGPASFGIFSLILALQTATLVVSTLGMDLALTKFIASTFARNKEMAAGYVRHGLTVVIVATTVSCAVLILLRDIVGSDIFGSDELASLIPASTLLIVSTSLLYVAYGTLRGYQRIAMLSVSRVLCSLTTFIAVIPLTILYGLNGAIIGFIVAQSITAIAIFTKVQFEFRVFHASSREYRVAARYRELMDFGTPAVLTGLLTGPAYLVGQSALAMTSGFEMLALFAVSMYFFQLFSTIARSISIPLVPKVAELWDSSREATRDLLQQSTHATILVMFPMAITLGLFADEAVGLLYGDEFLDAANPVYFMIVASFFASIASIVNSFLTGIGRIWLAFAVRGVWTAAFLILTLVLVPRLDEVGLALSFVGSYALLVAVSVPVSRIALSVNLVRVAALFALCGLIFSLVYGLTTSVDLGPIPRGIIAASISSPFAYSAWVRFLREGWRNLKLRRY